MNLVPVVNLHPFGFSIRKTTRTEFIFFGINFGKKIVILDTSGPFIDL